MDFVFNIAKGRYAYYADLPGQNDGLEAIPLATSGLQSDDDLEDHETLDDVLAANTEQADMGRVALSNVSVTVDNTSNRVSVTCDPITWSNATGDEISKVVIAYVPDVGVSTDEEIIPLFAHDLVVDPDGSTITVSLADGYLARTGD